MQMVSWRSVDRSRTPSDQRVDPAVAPTLDLMMLATSWRKRRAARGSLIPYRAQSRSSMFPNIVAEARLPSLTDGGSWRCYRKEGPACAQHAVVVL